MMNRIERFRELELHPFYGPKIKQFNDLEYTFCKHFLEKNMELDKGSFSDAVRNLFINVTKKPKKWATIDEVLMATNVEKK